MKAHTRCSFGATSMYPSKIPAAGEGQPLPGTGHGKSDRKPTELCTQDEKKALLCGSRLEGVSQFGREQGKSSDRRTPSSSREGHTPPWLEPRWMGPSGAALRAKKEPEGQKWLTKEAEIHTKAKHERTSQSQIFQRCSTPSLCQGLHPCICHKRELCVMTQWANSRFSCSNKTWWGENKSWPQRDQRVSTSEWRIRNHPWQGAAGLGPQAKGCLPQQKE